MAKAPENKSGVSKENCAADDDRDDRIGVARTVQARGRVMAQPNRPHSNIIAASLQVGDVAEADRMADTSRTLENPKLDSPGQVSGLASDL